MTYTYIINVLLLLLLLCCLSCTVQAGSEWLFIVPEGLYNLIMHTKEDYGDPLIFVTENGNIYTYSYYVTHIEILISTPI